MSTLSLTQSGGALNLKLGTTFDEVDANLNGTGNGVDIDVRGHVSTLKTTGATGIQNVTLSVAGSLIIATTFSGTSLWLAGDIGATVTLKDGIQSLDLSGLQNYNALVSGPNDFPASISCLNGHLDSLTITASSVIDNPGHYEFGNLSTDPGLSDADQGALLDLFLTCSDVSLLQLNLTGNHILSAGNVAKVATLEGNGAFITHS